MTVHNIVEKLNPEAFLIIFNKDGKRIWGGNRSTYIKYCTEDDIFDAEVQEINATSTGNITVTVG